MSGPKVVNIQALRRQQRRECAALLRELTAAVEACLRFQDAKSEASTEFETRSTTVLAQLNSLWGEEKWRELKAQTSAQRDFYRSEAEKLRQGNIERRATLLRREHRLRKAAAQMCAELQRLPGSADRDNALERLSAAEESVALQEAVGRALEVLSAARRDAADIVMADRIRELAAGYADPSRGAGSPTGPPRADRDPDEVRLERCLSLIGELALHEEASGLKSWKQKASRAEELIGDERSLMLDSLALDLSTYLRDRRAIETAVLGANSVLGEIGSMSTPGAETWQNRIKAALQEPANCERLQQLVAEARRWVALEIQREDAVEQRMAVLQALNSLGYEVREGMAAAWTEQGRVVVHKPQDSVYGLELSAPTTGSAFQVRVVGKGVPGRSKHRDLEVEQAWCGEFARLQALLAGSGFPTQVAVAREPGSIPIKTLTDTTPAEDSRRAQTNQLRTNREPGQ